MAQPGPNPQTNLIISIVAPVVALIFVAVLYFTKPVPPAVVATPPVNTTAAKLPDPGVVQANALPNSGTSTNTSATSAGGAMGGMGGGASMGPSAAGVGSAGGPSRGPTAAGVGPGGGGKSGKPKGGAMGAG